MTNSKENLIFFHILWLPSGFFQPPKNSSFFFLPPQIIHFNSVFFSILYKTHPFWWFFPPIFGVTPKSWIFFNDEIELCDP